MDANIVYDSCIEPINEDYTSRNQSASTEVNHVDFQTWILRLTSLVQDTKHDSFYEKKLEKVHGSSTILDPINAISMKPGRQTLGN